MYSRSTWSAATSLGAGVKTKGTRFPRGRLDFYADFAEWVQIFAHWGSNGTMGRHTDFNCYNPIDMMTRQLSCNGSSYI